MCSELALPKWVKLLLLLFCVTNLLTTRIFIAIIRTIEITIAFLFEWNACTASYTFKLSKLMWLYSKCKYFFFWEGIDEMMIWYLLRCVHIHILLHHRRHDNRPHHRKPLIVVCNRRIYNGTLRGCMLIFLDIFFRSVFKHVYLWLCKWMFVCVFG